MRRGLLLLCVLGLTACGVEGPPVRPDPKEEPSTATTSTSGIRGNIGVTGEVTVGVRG